MNTITLDDIQEVIAGSLKRRAAARAIGTDDDLSALGLDSLSVLNIIISAAARFCIDLERLDEEMQVPKTVADLLALLNDMNRSVTSTEADGGDCALV